jgi:hypothetical protein
MTPEELKLFTPIKESETKWHVTYIVVFDVDGYYDTDHAIFDGDSWRSSSTLERIDYEATHVLDLSKLTLKSECDELKSKLLDHLPKDCVMGETEVKFCIYRQGDGNECKHCRH